MPGYPAVRAAGLERPGWKGQTRGPAPPDGGAGPKTGQALDLPVPAATAQKM